MAQPDFQPVVFGKGIEALYAGHALSADAKAKLRALGVDPGKLAPAYPWHVWPDALEIVAADRYPGKSRLEAVDALGCAFVDEQTGSIVASIVGPIARAIGPERMLGRVGRAFKTTHNFYDTTVEKADGGFLLRVAPNAEALPVIGLRRWDVHEFMAAAIRSGLTTFLKLAVKVELRKRPDEASVTFFITW